MSKQGADLVALWISWDDKPEDEKPKDNKSQLRLLTYPPAVAEGPNYGIVHKDGPFDGGATVSQILSSSCIIAHVPRSRYGDKVNAAKFAMASEPIDLMRPYGIEPM